MPRKRDENETAFDTLEELVRRDAARDGKPLPPKPAPEKMAVRVKAGRKGGNVSGKRRTAKISKAQRSKTASRASRERWKRHNEID